MSTLTQLQVKLRERLGNPSTDDVADATLTLRLNEAYTDIWDRYKFYANRGTSTSITTISGTNSYTLPTTADAIMGVRDVTNKAKLSRWDKDQWDTAQQTTTTSLNKPVHYFRDGTTLYLDPCPDGAYSIFTRFKKSITELASGSDVPAIPSSWHPGIVLLARYKHWETNTNLSMMDIALKVWQVWVSDKVDEISEELFYDSSIHVQPETLTPGTDRLDFDHSDR